MLIKRKMPATKKTIFLNTPGIKIQGEAMMITATVRWIPRGDMIFPVYSVCFLLSSKMLFLLPAFHDYHKFPSQAVLIFLKMISDIVSTSPNDFFVKFSEFACNYHSPTLFQDFR